MSTRIARTAVLALCAALGLAAGYIGHIASEFRQAIEAPHDVGTSPPPIAPGIALTERGSRPPD